MLTSTNLTAPPSNWTRVATNVFDENGDFRYTNVIGPGSLQQFFNVRVP